MMQAQSQMMENFISTGKKLPDLFGQPDMLNKTGALYQEWFEKQKEILQGVFPQAAFPNVEQLGAMPEFFKPMMDAMSKLSGNMLETMRVMTENFSNKAGIDTYQQQSEQVFANLKKVYDESMSKVNSPIGKMGYNPVDFAKEINDRLIDGAKNYLKWFEKKS